jgi:hypothetical protein
MKRVCFCLLIAASIVLSMACVSLGDDAFLVKSLDDANKSTALTNQGIAAYNSLIGQADYEKAADVQRFFVVALRYNPGNLKAKQYLDKIDDFRNGIVRDKLKTANRLLAKSPRKEEDNFAIIVALQTAVSIDPSNDEATKLLKDNASVQSGLVDAYLQRSKDAQAKAADASASASFRESGYLRAYDNAAKAVLVAPSNAQAAKQKAALGSELDKAFDSHKDAAAKLVAKGKFEDARVELASMRSLDDRLDDRHAAQISAATYDLNLKWAKALYAKNLLQDADDKLDLAIAAKRGDEAIALKAKIAQKSSSADQAAAFTAALPEIDRLIAKGDLLGANKRLLATAKLTKDRAKLNQLDDRRSQISDGLGALYEKGIAAYRAEDFKSAIAQLSVVVKIDAEYEQASDYLDKAREKQRLLSQYDD